LTAFNTAAAAYNTKAKEEKARKADATKAVFDPPIAVPARPCAPTVPAAYAGPVPNFAGTAALTAAQKTANAATWAENSGVAAATSSFKMGYLQVNAADTATAGDVNAGHVFGILGQEKTWPTAWSTTTTKAAFQWKAAADAHSMLVSILPYLKAQAAKDATITASPVMFKTDFSIAVTAKSATALTVLETVGAKALVASAAAVTAVAASLF
jgi:hypothetical protein